MVATARFRVRARRSRPVCLHVGASARLAPAVAIAVIGVVLNATAPLAAASPRPAARLPVVTIPPPPPDRASAAPRRGLIAHYVAPVDAPIIDHFRPPACRWCSGNRGIDYGTSAGVVVRAAAAGRVSFAGQVGGDLFVVVTHPDGLRTTYGFLGAISVRDGDVVAQGQAVATTAGPLHFGVRRGDVYLDPELILAGGVLRAHLVPSNGSPPRAF
jgi:murein DD-endopeptidase MepM/ murein hydrolase activator NlpD